MAHPLQVVHVTDGKELVVLTVEQIAALLTERGYVVIDRDDWIQAADVVKCARRVAQLRNNGEESTKANDELAYAIDQLDGEDHG